MPQKKGETGEIVGVETRGRIERMPPRPAPTMILPKPIMANGIHVRQKDVSRHELQTQTLQAFAKGKHEVTIWLMNQASPIVGRVKYFDTYTVTVSGSDGKYHLLFKHGIAGFSVDAEIFRNMKFSEEKESAPALDASERLSKSV